ncbi:antitoxin Xre-like helix-turn-helix domain-containing protein [Legionella septentrionalis]|uniref:sigma-70 region 4 domain-containing protein n=1 Tax=Legionella septentrionalis TaxID=2498109 RepID=UPI000F8D1535|nr:sigma-70 region 4 domain-containing protein [Legionella septentrionalis]RUR08844.1 hypothetical protein ELY14_10555 [Legionella septentrionalis]
MRTSSINNPASANQDAILTKAILKMANFYGLNGKELSEILGISEATATRLHQGKKQLGNVPKVF